VRSGTTWTQQAKLVASDYAANDLFGWTVSVSGETAIVGAHQDGHAGGTFAGSAYVFVRDGTKWSQQAKLIAPDAQPGDSFGWVVSLSGETALIGARSDDHAGGTDAGSTYVFVRNGTAWFHQAKLMASDAAALDEFGRSAHVRGNTAIVGAWLDDHAGGVDAGSAYIFVRNGIFWTQQAKVTAADAAAGDAFGHSVAIAGEKVVVGAPNDDHAGGTDSGSIYAFLRSGTTWTEQNKLVASDASPFAYFGDAVAMEENRAVVGAPPASKAYVHRLWRVWTDLGSGLAGVSGVPNLTGTGTLEPGMPASVDLTNAAPNAIGLIAGSLTSTPKNMLGGVLVPFPFVAASPIVTDAVGSLSLTWIGWPPWYDPGQSIYFQYVIADAAGPHGVSLSNALKATTP
jgi:hypothetical protein